MWKVKEWRWAGDKGGGIANPDEAGEGSEKMRILTIIFKSTRLLRSPVFFYAPLTNLWRERETLALAAVLLLQTL